VRPTGALPLDKIAPEVVPGVRLLPVLHERVDLAALARLVLDALDPAAVAVELPTTLAEATERAVLRLPQVSVVISEEEGEDALIWVAAPGDPLVEGLRWALERGRPTFLVDPDVPYRGRHREPYPDPHTLWLLGPERYLTLVRALAAHGERDDSDALRERGMAYHIQQARSAVDGCLLCLIGAAHVDGVARLLVGPTAPPFARQQRSRVSLRHLHPESMTALLPDPPLAHAVFEAVRGGEPSEPTPFEAAVSRRVELLEAGLRLITGESVDDTAERRRALVRYAAHRGTRRGPTGAQVPDRAALAAVVFRVAASSWHVATGERPVRWQRRLFFEFLRRYARVEGLLLGGLYEWTIAGRAVADDNLAWELFDAARCYPAQEESAELETARIDGDGSRIHTRPERRFYEEGE
jgi:hypothetical protein